MHLRWCGDCGSSMRLNGRKSVGYRDLDGDGSVERRTQVQRLSCRRCPNVAYEGRPRLQPGYRVTSDLFRSIAGACLHASYQTVSERFDVDRKTVRRIWNDWVEAAPIPSLPEVAILRRLALAGTHVSAIAENVSGRILRTYDGPTDPRLATTVAGMTHGILVTDLHHLGVARTHRRGDLRIVCDRRSMTDLLSIWFARIARKARTWMDVDEARRLDEILPVLAKAHVERSPDDDEAVRSAGRHGRIRDLVGALDGFRRIWATRVGEACASRYREWRKGLSAFAEDVFRSLTSAIESLGTAPFQDAPSGVPASFVLPRTVPERDRSNGSPTPADRLSFLATLPAPTARSHRAAPHPFSGRTGAATANPGSPRDLGPSPEEVERRERRQLEEPTSPWAPRSR